MLVRLMAGVRLRELSSSQLYRRRYGRHSGLLEMWGSRSEPPTPGNMSEALASATCGHCRSHFDPMERIVNSNGELYHEKCFVCAQCFQQFPGGVFYEFEGRKYCEHDFQMLFAPCCGQCGENSFTCSRCVCVSSMSG
ncbi:LIM and senescent cell antigen-like-containing domain protein 2 [Mobula birostris]|uniref:LIM and senescent cell antigen-like-containing domain protein 2 n=1 Tax=Mobula birostris TaxID=1983395 RepID=UPI003B2857AC